MGKKTQPKGRNPRKAIRQVAAGSNKPVEESKTTEDCSHYTKSIDELNRILSGILSPYDNAASCEHCREEPLNKRGNKEKGGGKHQHKKKGGGGGGARAPEPKPEPSAVWVCLDCGHCFCGGAVKDTEPYGHARRHAKHELHPWAVRFDNPRTCWCFPCNSLVPLDMPEGLIGEAKPAVGVEDGSLGGIVGQGKGGENRGTPYLERSKGRIVRGLVNLGNTCFFNSVMQNLFVMDTLREYLASLERPPGPLTISLKKLFVETSAMADSRGPLSPKAFFGCICAKAPQFRGYQQQDSHELLRSLLDGLSTEETSARKLSLEHDKVSLNSGDTFVDAIFGGQLSSTVSCVECGHTSVVHEPFLDLSLPVPSKKIPPKKTPSPLPKRSKPPLRERSKGRKFREKGVAKEAAANDHHRLGNINSPAECTEHHVPASEPEQNVAAEVEEGSSWMAYIEPNNIPDNMGSVSQTSEIQNVASEVEGDYSWMAFLDPSLMPDGTDLVSQENEISVAQYSVTGHMGQSETNVQCASNSQAEGCSEEPMVSSDSFGESSCRDEVPSSCTQDSDVILLPYKEVNPSAEETNEMLSCPQNSENLTSTNPTVVGSSVQTTSIAVCEQAEADLDGIGDLFNEPEVTSEFKAEAATSQEVDTILWGGNSSESNQDEVDNTNALVSINSCLALFTKPELLSDEHSWHCERCSEILAHQNTGHREGKRLAARLSQSEASNSQGNGCEVQNKKSLQNMEVESKASTEFIVGGNGETSSNTIKADSHDDEYPIEEANKSQKPLSLVGGPDNMKHTNEGTGNDEKKLFDIIDSDQAQSRCTDVTLKDEDSQYLSGGLVHEETLSQDNQESDSCSINDFSKVRSGGHAFLDSSTCAPDHTKTSLLCSCEKDNSSEVNKMENKGSQSLAKVHPSDDSRGIEMKSKIRMVKRDAMKRILINKIPPILTVHLKRFGQDARGRLSKLSGHVSFQETLDLRPYMDPRCEDKDKDKCRYQLIGVVEHSGSMSGGHYVAYVRADKSKDRSREGGSHLWFYASDAHVRETSLSEVLQSEAYILFYERV